MIKRNFITEASFYQSNQGALCRKYLTIRRPEIAAESPELVFLMLNPGSCGQEDFVHSQQLVKVAPDPTLHRVQQLMEMESISCVRVLNLWDWVNADGKEITKTLSQLSTFPPDSVFSGNLTKLLPDGVPILIAWGVVAQKLPLAQQALLQLKQAGHKVINEAGPHWHPLVRPTLDTHLNPRPLWTRHAADLLQHFKKST